MTAQGGPSEARRAKEDASVDCAEEMKDTTGVSPWGHYCLGDTCRLTTGEKLKSLTAPSVFSTTTSSYNIESRKEVRLC